jgi:plasmid stability protein
LLYGFSVTITLKNIPPQLHSLLKEQAKRNKRSLNQEAILRLEEAVMGTRTKATLHTAPAGISVGAVLQPMTSREEMLDDFLGRSE